MIKEEYKHSDITGKIIKCAYTVHRTLGCGFQEVVYQRSLAIEFDYEGLSYVREQEMPLFYRDQQVGVRRVDFLVENAVLIELKAMSVTEDVHLAQAINYLEAFKLEVGLLINFGGMQFSFRRLMKNEYQLKKGNQIGFNEYKKG